MHNSNLETESQALGLLSCLNYLRNTLKTVKVSCYFVLCLRRVHLEQIFKEHI
jgi:hypothetical protein